MKKPKLFISVNNPLFVLQHLLPLVSRLERKTKVFILCPYDKKFQLKIKNINIIYLPIRREPSYLDLVISIIFGFYRIIYRPSISISFTPKAGLINALTFFLPGKTFHYFTGQRWVKFKGIKLLFFKLIDRFIISCSNKVFCDSFSQSKFISKTLITKKPIVLGKGSLSGVNIEKFIHGDISLIKKMIKNDKNIPEIFHKLISEEKKQQLNIFGFIGRLHLDKGIKELIDSFKLHYKNNPNSYLITIGPNELSKYDFKKLESLPNTLHIDFIREIHLILPFLDCLVLPSHREGFGSVIIEAAASSVPVITSNIPGPNDFIKHKENGYLVKPKSVYSLKKGLDFMSQNKEIAKEYAKKSFNICKEHFAEEYVCDLFVKTLIEEF